jgi:hypothetical protein
VNKNKPTRKIPKFQQMQVSTDADLGIFFTTFNYLFLEQLALNEGIIYVFL